MQNICKKHSQYTNKYADNMQKICKIHAKYMQYMHTCTKYAKQICKKYAAGLTSMQQVQHAEYAKKKMQTICNLYVKYAVYANHATNMQNMHRGLC